MEKTLDLGRIRLFTRDTRGEKPALVLLHGWPQTSACWEEVTPALAEHFRVIAPDLRGYGFSDKPGQGYEKKSMAADIRALLDHLGIERCSIVGHDRGARVAHRFALDFPDRVKRLSLLDVAPTLHAFRHATPETAQRYWHWLFHLKPDLPELLAGANVEAYLRYFFADWSVQTARLEPVIPEYVAAFSQPGAMRAGFDDYRATPQDVEDDAQDFEAGKRLRLPLQVLWGAGCLLGSSDVLAVWRAYAEDVVGEEMQDCGHFIAEEQPEELLARLLPFLREG